MKKLLLSLLISLLIGSLQSKADEHTLTTGNLITNGNFETGNANGWTQTGQGRAIADCCTLGNKTTSNYDYEFGNSGSISQEFNLVTDDITQEMLNNGITLNSTIEVQNGECNVAGCWSGGNTGPADTFTNQLSILDSEGNELASVTQIRKNVTGINGQDFTDQLIYNGVGSYFGDITISGTDANAPATLGGPNVDNISVTMTYDPEVMPMSIQNELIATTENLYTEFEEIERFVKFEKFEEEFKFEEKFENTTVMKFEEEKIEEFTYMPMEMFEEEKILETPKTEFQEMVLNNEKIEEEQTSMMEEIFSEFEEENPSEIEEQEQTSSLAEERTIEEKNTSQEKEQEPPQRSEVASKNTSSASGEKESFSVSLDKVMNKIDAKVKEIDKNLQIKNIVKINAMVDNDILLEYNKPFYKEFKIYERQIDIQDNRVIYTANLEAYTRADPISVQRNKVMDIRLQKQKLRQELEVLKNEF